MINNYCPRPDFKRENVTCLCGEWDFDFDENNKGLKEKWYKDRKFSRKIIVPYAYQSPLSLINENKKCDVIWYKRTFKASVKTGKRLFLVFMAVDWESDVYLNGEKLGHNEGGYTPFKFDITLLLKSENTLTVRVTDTFNRFIPRGKQYCLPAIDMCWYEGSSGIWQDVYLEETGTSYFENVLITPSFKKSLIETEIITKNFVDGQSVSLKISFKGETIKTLTASLDGEVTKVTVNLKELNFVSDWQYFWSPDHPNLFDVSISLIEREKEVDNVLTYFGMRDIETRGGQILLNNSPIYQKLILAQGYYAGGHYTASDEQLKKDIELIKSYGFNGVRMHQKIENPRFYYWADKLGLLVWGELPSAYEYCVSEVENLSKLMTEFIKRDYNHPCIITWVPLNESWGVRNIRHNTTQIAFAKSLYFLIKSIDPSRLVSGNDGWENIESDIINVHNYDAGGALFSNRVGNEENYCNKSVNDYRAVMADGEKIQGRPIILSEFGGIAFSSDNGWGYSGAANSESEFLIRFSDLIDRTLEIPFLQGYCYTQFTDVYQETNGLLDMDRREKVDKLKVQKIISKNSIKR